MLKGRPDTYPGDGLNQIEGNYEALAPETKLVFCISCLEDEQRVLQALKTYLHLDAAERAQCEVCILVNSEKGNESSLATEIKKIAANQPGLRISVYTGKFPEGTDPAVVQDELFRVVRERSTGANAPLIVSHHADLLSMPSEYIGNILETFEAEPDLDLLAGLVDYPMEDFRQNHLFFAVQCFEDLLELKIREETGSVLAHGGNTAFRLSAMDKPGFRDIFEADNAPIYLKPRKAVEGINVSADDELMWVTTAARRQMSALGNVPPTRLADRYNASITNTLSEAAHKVTSANFTLLLEQELLAIWDKVIKNAPYGLTQDKLSSLFVDAGRQMGIVLEIKDSSLKVKDLAGFKERVVKEFSTF